MAYIINESGVMVSIPNNAPLPSGARWANDDEVTNWLEAERVRTAAGLPAPKTPQQAQLEHEALRENIARRGGLATPQEIANLNMTAEQMNAPALPVDQPPVTRADTRSQVAAPVTTEGSTTPPISLAGRGASAGDQYTQYESVPGLAKVVVDESAAADETPDSGRVETVVTDDSRPAPTRADASETESGKPSLPEGKRDLPNDTPEERAKNSPTAKSKEK